MLCCQIIESILCVDRINESEGNVNVDLLPAADYQFDIRVETDIRQVYRRLGNVFTAYKDERRGPTFVAVQSTLGESGSRMTGYCACFVF